jgi:hypothetical protein
MLVSVASAVLLPIALPFTARLSSCCQRATKYQSESRPQWVGSRSDALDAGKIGATSINLLIQTDFTPLPRDFRD